MDFTLDEFIEAYKNEFEKKDLQKIATVLKAIDPEHKLVKKFESDKNNPEWVNYRNDEYGIQFAYQESWVSPYVKVDEESDLISLSFGPVANRESGLGLLYNLTVHINKPNVKFGLVSTGCGKEKLFNVVCQTFDPYLDPEKLEQVDLNDQEVLISRFVEKFTVNGLSAYSSKFEDSFIWKNVFISGLRNGYQFTGMASDDDYERVVQSFQEDIDRQIEWYEERFSGHMLEDIKICPEKLLSDDISSPSISYYGGYEINGCKYNHNRTLEYNYSKLACAETVKDELDKHDYSLVNGCLLNKGERVFEENLFTKVIYGDFGQEYLKTRVPENRKDMGESAVEWFRFEDNGKLYIFLKGVAGCDLCIYNGPYLIIDLQTRQIQTKNADLSYLPHNILSPNHKKAITFDFDNGSDANNWQISKVKLSVFDFLTMDKKEIYSVPDAAAVLGKGMGYFFIDEAIKWIDDSTIQIQLFEGLGASSGETINKEGFTDFKHNKQGDPIIIPIN